MSIVFLFDENPDVASAGSGGAAVGGARSVPDHAARSNSERAAPSARVGNRFRLLRLSGPPHHHLRRTWRLVRLRRPRPCPRARRQSELRLQRERFQLRPVRRPCPRNRRLAADRSRHGGSHSLRSFVGSENVGGYVRPEASDTEGCGGQQRPPPALAHHTEDGLPDIAQQSRPVVEGSKTPHDGARARAERRAARAAIRQC